MKTNAVERGSEDIISLTHARLIQGRSAVLVALFSLLSSLIAIDDTRHSHQASMAQLLGFSGRSRNQPVTFTFISLASFRRGYDTER